MIGVGIQEEETYDIPPSPLRLAVELSEDPELAEGDAQFMSLLVYMYVHSL